MTTSNKKMPRGSEFFEAVAKVEAQCGTESLADIPKLGISTPACYESLGDVLSMLYAEAACFYGCAGGDHFLQRIIARIVTHSLSSLRLFSLCYCHSSLAP